MKDREEQLTWAKQRARICVGNGQFLGRSAQACANLDENPLTKGARNNQRQGDARIQSGGDGRGARPGFPSADRVDRELRVNPDHERQPFERRGLDRRRKQTEKGRGEGLAPGVAMPIAFFGGRRKRPAARTGAADQWEPALGVPGRGRRRARRRRPDGPASYMALA